MKLQRWLILSALVIGASVRAAGEPAAKPVETAWVSVLQKAGGNAKKMTE